MKKLLLLATLFLTSGLSAQVTLTLTGPATARPGNAVTVNLTGAMSGSPVALQWTVGLPTGFTATASIGAAGTAAAKTLSCSANATLCLEYGLNTTVIGNGTLAAYTVTIPANATPGAGAFPLSGLLAVNAAGTTVTSASGPAYSLTILSLADINGDGIVNATDVQLMVNQITSGGTCSNDQNGDGKCDLLDVWIVIMRALGL